MRDRIRLETLLGSAVTALQSDAGRHAARAAGAAAMALIALALLLGLCLKPGRDPLMRGTFGALAGLFAAASWLAWPRREHALEPPLHAEISRRRIAIALHEQAQRKTVASSLAGREQGLIPGAVDEQS